MQAVLAGVKSSGAAAGHLKLISLRLL